MKKKVIISGTSFLNPEHVSWKEISNSYTVNFLDYGNYANAMFKENDKAIIVIVIYLQDLLDINDKFYQAKKKLNSILKLINSRAERSNSFTIICISKGRTEHQIRNARVSSIYFYAFNWFLFEIEKIAKKNQNLLYINLDEVFSQYGESVIFDNRNWYHAHCRYSSLGLRIMSSSIKTIIERIFSPVSKLLVLDCDNTIWGGIVAEDGIENIKLGADGVGAAYLDFQKQIKWLSKQGIMIAIASKNNEQDVLDVFNKNKFMILNLKDLVGYRINWQEKSKNLLSFSKDLGINLDSFVFWDDNPLERDKMRLALPDVITVEPPKNIFDWPNHLKNLNILSQFYQTEEDKSKVKQYKNRAKFIKDLKRVKDDFSYLSSIGLKATTLNIDKYNMNRAVQLCQKTNQFNLRTKRHSSKDLSQMVIENKHFCILTKLKDQYGDHGIVGLFCLKELDKNNVFLDTFLVSCRVLGRYFEVWMLYKALEIANQRGFYNLIGEYIPTEKNLLVKDFLGKYGFKNIKKNDIELLRKNNLILNNKSIVLKKNTKETTSPVLSLYG